MKDPRHPEHDDRRAWIGGDFDPGEFDLAQCDEAVRGARELGRSGW